MLFLLIPTLFVSVGWFLHDPIHLLQSFVLIAWAFALLFFTKNLNWAKNRFVIAPLLIPFGYLISGFINNQSINQMIVGEYQRNFGLGTTIALSVIFILSTNPNLDGTKIINYGLFSVLIFATIYGYLQFFGLDPLPWKLENEGITLTLGNPNFSGAFFGMLTVISVAKFLDSQTKISKIGYATFFCATFFIGLQTKSLQHVILIIVSFYIYLNIRFHKNNKWLAKFLKTTNITLALLTPIIAGIFIFTDLMTNLKQKIIIQGNVYQRIDMIKNGIDIWRDNPFFGVGIEQFQRYAGLYRTPTQIVRDGVMVIPDKSHNILIDHLSTGGVITGFAWIVMVISIFYVIYKLITRGNPLSHTAILAISIWFAYFIQSLISPDQLILAAIGFIAGGLVISEYMKPSISSEKNKSTKSNLNIVRIPVLIVLILFLTVYGRAIQANIESKKMLEGRVSDSGSYLKTINMFPNEKISELLVIELVKDYKNCDLAVQVAESMIKINERSSQAWFIKALCANVEGSFINAINFVDKSLEFDPLNPFYLVSKAKLEIADNRISSAKATVNKVREVNPPESCIGDLLQNTEPCGILRDIVSLDYSIENIEKKSSN